MFTAVSYYVPRQIHAVGAMVSMDEGLLIGDPCIPGICIVVHIKVNTNDSTSHNGSLSRLHNH